MKYKLVIEADGVEVFNEELGSECVEGLANNFEDISENRELFGLLAKSSSSEVRKAIARKDNLNEASLELLAQDPSIEVWRYLCTQTVFQKWASTEMLLKYIDGDIECASRIAQNIREFINADEKKIEGTVSAHSDPIVRKSFADGYGASKRLLKQLLSDPDAGVRAAAKRSLD